MIQTNTCAIQITDKIIGIVDDVSVEEMTVSIMMYRQIKVS
jgi:hypothetical protein